MDFAEIAPRHYCRNPRCRSKLPNPTSNPREAFCARGCHAGFYRKRCLVCEGSMERKTEHQRICKKSRCRSAFRGGLEFGRYAASQTGGSTPKTSIKHGVQEAPEAGRTWRIVAGTLTASQLHCATVPDGPGCRWEGGAWARAEAASKAALEAAEAREIEANGYFWSLPPLQASLVSQTDGAATSIATST
jgi:hypothetical protein